MRPAGKRALRYVNEGGFIRKPGPATPAAFALCQYPEVKAQSPVLQKLHPVNNHYPKYQREA
jgi:hypothetical protein